MTNFKYLFTYLLLNTKQKWLEFLNEYDFVAGILKARRIRWLMCLTKEDTSLP